MSRSALIRLDNFSWNLCKMGFTLSFEQLCKTVFVILTIFTPFSLSSFVATILKGYLYSLKSSHLQTSCLRKTFCSWQMWTKSTINHLDPGLFPSTTSTLLRCHPSPFPSPHFNSSSTCSTSAGSQFIHNSSSFTSSSMCNISSSTSAMILSTESPMFKIVRLSASEVGKQLSTDSF